MPVSELKQLVMFMKEQGVKSFMFENISVEFFEPPKPPLADAPVADTKSPEEQAEDIDQLLFASAGY